MTSKFSISVGREPSVLFMWLNINSLDHFMPSKRSSNQLFPMRLINNPSSGKLKSTWNLTIPTLSSFIVLFALTKTFTLSWSSANLEISTKKWDKLDLSKSQRSEALSDKSAAPLTTCMKKTSFTGTLRLKTLSFMTRLLRSVILDGPVKENTQENLSVEHQLTFHLKSFKINFTTRKLTFGAQESWHLSWSLEEFHLISEPKKIWGKLLKRSWNSLMKDKSRLNAKIS